MSLSEVLRYISFTVCFISLLTAFFFLFFYKKSDSMMKKMAIYFVVAGIVEITAAVIGSIYHQNNLFLFHFFAAFEIFILGHFFFDFYEKLGAKIQRNYLIYSTLLVVVANSLFLQPFDTFNSYALTFVSIVVIGLSAFSFYLMLEKDVRFPYQQELKWLIISIFLLHCNSLMVLFFSNKILSFGKDQQSIIWICRASIILIIKLLQCLMAYRIITKQKDVKLKFFQYE